MTRFEKQKTPLLHTAIVVGLALVFLVDLLTPLGLAEWVFYLVPVALTLYVWRPSVPLWVALTCTLLTAAGVWVSPPVPAGFPAWIPLANRLMAIANIWVVAIVARQFVLSRLSLRKQEWIRNGQTELVLRIQGEQTPAQLGDSILSCLCEYLEVPVGALYVSDSKDTLRCQATHAGGSRAPAPERLAVGEGLVGQAAKDRRIMRLDDLPEHYLPIASALGRSNPRHLVIVPLEVEDLVEGVVELGFLRPVQRSDMELLDAAAERIAIALRAAQYRARQAELLEATRRQEAALRSQQEALRATNEELEEQTRALHDSQARLEEQQAELEQTNSQLEEQAQTLEQQRDELSRAQVELVEKAEELTRLSQYKSEFLANMSHELRTPLNSALILAKLLADNEAGNLTPEQVRYASTIHSSGNDLLVLINDILDLSRVEAGRMELHVEPVDVERTIESLRRTFQPLAAQKGLSFAVEIAPDVPRTIIGDSLRVQQILRNLLANAFKFTDEGSVSLRVAIAGERLAFAVEDSGIGVPKDQHQIIFEAFRQANGTTTRRHGGTGLGLTISRELARLLGGDLSVESAPGRGSVFTLTIPRVLESPGEEPARAAPAAMRAAIRPVMSPSSISEPRRAPNVGPPAVPDDRQSLRADERSILIIEDDEAFAQILRDLARERSFRALVATDATEGLRLAEEFAPSAILLDIHLPDNSGLAVLERLKRNPGTRHIPVHVVSVVDYAQRALELGAIGYALKPVRREELVEAVKKLERRLEQKLRHVLVVEDVSVQRESIVELLRGEHVTVLPVATGAEALARLQETTFDCMVLDLTLPDMSGYELLDRMAACEALSCPPVIVYTGRALDREDEERLDRYASSIIIKGARSPERLLDEVMLFLHQVEGSLPIEQQRILREVRNRDAALEGRDVLIVDDDARSIFALASVLESKGASVRLARNGNEALAALEDAAGSDRRGVDLVLMDVMMPEMDGLTAMREIRKRREWKKLPIIALTAKAMAKDRDECLGAGADDYIAKPLDVDKLLSLVRVWLPK